MLIPLEILISDELWRIACIVAIILAGIIVTALVLPIVQAFKSDLKYINMEIHRTDGREQAHWIRRKRELWLSLIPFYRPRRRHHHHHHDD